jgi:hypothetical protein
LKKPSRTFSKNIKRRALTKNNIEISGEEVYSRISAIIPKLSEVQARNLLKVLEKWEQSSFTEKRKFPRKPILITVYSSGQIFAWTDLIQNLSCSGLYIETQLPLYVGDELSMTFSLTNAENPIKIKGKIVRIDSKGIGVEFDESLTDI